MKPLLMRKISLILFILFSSHTLAASGEQEKTVVRQDGLEQYRVECVSKINTYRAMEGKSALKRWVDQEMCSDSSAQREFEEKGVHVSFQDCGELAQNLCPGYASFEQVIDGCLAQMWNEGPGEPFSKHGHYINMSNSKYRKVACGFYTDSEGKVWHIQNFR